MYDKITQTMASSVQKLPPYRLIGYINNIEEFFFLMPVLNQIVVLWNNTLPYADFINTFENFQITFF